jgi:hypothetical protein
MDYRKIIKSRKIRLKILAALDFVPDSLMVRLQYRIKTGHVLHLKEPRRFTEKLQWYKLYYRNPVMKQCVDKYEVRGYVGQCGCGELLNELYGLYNTPDEIDFDRLPDSFVLKDTLGGGGNAVILVKDKSRFDREAAKKQMWEWVNTPIRRKHPGREWVYEGQRHRIIAERYLEDENSDLPDFKFYCFDGKVSVYYIRRGYAKSHKDGKVLFYDAHDRRLSVQIDYCSADEKHAKVPGIVQEMKVYAERIAKSFPHARVDFYAVDGKVVFGEITFFTASGYFRFQPDSFDFKLGEKFQLKSEMGERVAFGK